MTPGVRGKYHPDSKSIASNHKSQEGEEEGIGVDVDWAMLFVQINMQAGRFQKGGFSMNVYSLSSVKAFWSLSLNISHSHVHF